MRFTPKQSRSRPTALNLTPMIDVIFLLLIFFVTTTTITLPESRLSPAIQTTRRESGPGASDFSPQIVSVETLDGLPIYRIGTRVIRDRIELTELLSELPHEPGVFVKVSDFTTVEHAASALQACRDAGFEKVTYVPAQ